MTAQPSGMARVILRNAGSQAAGRMLMTLLRFGVALIVLKSGGVELFGQYALVLSLLAVAEWLVDFGQTDIAVRNLSVAPAQSGPTLAALAAIKLACVLVAVPALWLTAVLLGWPLALQQAMWAGAVAVPLYAAVLVYRVELRTQLRMDRDAAAELLSTVVLLLSSWLVCRQGPSLPGLLLCFAAARGVYLMGCIAWARGAPRWHFAAGWQRQLGPLVRASLPLGLVGLVVCAYDALDVLALTAWADHSETGNFSAALRVVMLAVIVVQALAMAVFPVLARQWVADRAMFQRTMQATLDAALLVGGALCCTLAVAAPGIAQLLHPPGQAIAAALALLSWAILARVVVTVIGPMVIIAGRQIHHIWLTLLVLFAKAAALYWLVPLAGASGAAGAYLISEVAVGLLPTIWLCQRVGGVRLSWSVPLRVLAAVVVVSGGAHWIGLPGSLWDGAAAAGVFALLCLAFGAVRRDDFRRLRTALAQRRAPDPALPAVASE